MRIPEDLEAYNVTVEKPGHIPNLVNLTQYLAREEPVLIGLDHQEGHEGRHAMRGRYEEFGQLESGKNAFRRPDGGNTVYTDNSKYALNFGIPVGLEDQKKANTYTGALHDFFDEKTEASLQRGDRDLYVGNDQIVGTSQVFGDASVVLRSYWAEEVPNIYDIMHQDGLSEEDIQRHHRAMQKSKELMGGQDFYQAVMDEFQAEELTSQELLEQYFERPEEAAEKLLQEDGYRDAKVCFLERPWK